MKAILSLLLVLASCGFAEAGGRQQVVVLRDVDDCNHGVVQQRVFVQRAPVVRQRVIVQRQFRSRGFVGGGGGQRNVNFGLFNFN